MFSRWLENNMDYVFMVAAIFNLIAARGGSSLAVMAGTVLVVVLAVRAHNAGKPSFRR